MSLPGGPAGPVWLRVRVAQSTRDGGVSAPPYASLNLAGHVGDDPTAVAANRARLRERHRLPAEPLWLEQVHGREVAQHDGRHAPGEVPRADAAVAFEPGRVCAVMTADCLPVVFVDTQGTRVGVAHAGWRGLADGVLEATVAALAVEPGRVHAWLGPAIGPGAFAVGAEVRDAFLATNPHAAEAFVPAASGTWRADLYRLARQRLSVLGLASIEGGGQCTFSDAANYYSYRREARTGRMATLAWLP